LEINWFPLFNQLFVLHMWNKFAYVSNCVFEMNAIWNPYILFFVKIYVGFVADIDIKILRCPPLGPGMPFLDSDTCTEGGGNLFLSGFFSLYDAVHRWMMKWMDEWTGHVMKKASLKTIMTSFTICNESHCTTLQYSTTTLKEVCFVMLRSPHP